MAATVLDQILDDLRGQAVTHYPQRGEFKNLRVVGHTPKNDHFIYDVYSDFTPLNVVVTENGVGFCDFARMKRRGNSFEDLATFLASVEALEKYPFCNRSITGQIQEHFLNAYNVSQSDAAILRVFKMKALLGLFAQARPVKERAG